MNKNSEDSRCTLCKSPADTLRRGLCEACYSKYRRNKAKLPKSLADEYEAMMVARGHLLPDARSSEDPFALGVAELLEKYDINADQKPEEPKPKPKPKPPKKKSSKKTNSLNSRIEFRG